MRRLSIIDLAGGHQPIFNQDGTVGVVLNGEIYNFKELRQQLEDRGHAFRTHSDSEVVAHAYDEWGAECVERLQGMFAFAVHDRRKSESGKLFLARDRFGIKPLYYSVTKSKHPCPKSSREQGRWTLTLDVGQEFCFASEVRPLLASGWCETSVACGSGKLFIVWLGK